MSENPRLEADLVQEFVAKAHGDFDRTKELLEQEPALVNAAWDWGGGDWETGLGAAAHTGQADIARHLIANGARVDVFAAAMLGKTAIVRAMFEDNPQLKQASGPHGIPSRGTREGRRRAGRAGPRGPSVAT